MHSTSVPEKKVESSHHDSPINSLEKLKNSYSSELGQIELDYEFNAESKPKEKNWLIFQLGVRTLFKGIQLYHSEKDQLTAYSKFFRNIIVRGVPRDILLCAALVTDDVTTLDYVKEEWNCNLHLALQYAVIEFLTDWNRLGQEKWLAIIHKLLANGANPNYPSNSYKNILANNTNFGFSETTAFQVLLFFRKFDDKVMKLATTFSDQQKKFAIKLNLTNQQWILLYDQIKHDASHSLIKNSCFQWLDTNYPELLSNIIKNRSYDYDLIYKLALDKDYESIEHLRLKHKIDPYSILFYREEPKVCWMQSSIFKYIDTHFHERLKNDIHTSVRTMERMNVPQLIEQEKFNTIDEYKQYYGIDPFLLLPDEMVWPPSGLAQYIEQREFQRIKEYYAKQLVRLVTKNRYDLIATLKERYKIDIYSTLEKAYEAKDIDSPVFNYLRRNFPKEFQSYLNNYQEYYIRQYVRKGNYEEAEKFNQFVAIALSLLTECYDPNSLFNFMAPRYHDKMKLYFNNKENLTLIKKLFDASEPITYYCVYHFNFDPYLLFPSLNEKAEEKLNQYYLQRCKRILDFILNQKYPKAAERHLKANGQIPSNFVPIDLDTIVQELKSTLKETKSSNHATKTYSKIIKELAPALIVNDSSARDESEQLIYVALVSVLSNESPLSLHIEREFDIQQECIPFLCGLKSESSTIAKMSKEPRFDRKVLGLIFPYLGNYGCKDGGESGTIEEDQENLPVKFHF